MNHLFNHVYDDPNLRDGGVATWQQSRRRKSRSSSKRPLITGAWGGVTPQGQILCNFFFDTKENPESITLHVGKTGEAEESGRTGDQRLIREVVVGIVLRPDHAHGIGAWLQKNAIEAGFNPDKAKAKG